MSSIISEKFIAHAYWMMCCAAVLCAVFGCDTKTASTKAAQVSTYESALRLADACRNKTPAYDRATSCIAYAKLTDATHLNLTNFGLERLPPSLFELTHLTVLNLGKNQLSVLPDDIGKLNGLTTLHLFGNQLTTLPETMHHFKRLRWLNLINNRLTQVPPVIFQLARLRRLRLGKNKLTELPDQFDKLPHLELLDLKHNQLASIPKSLMALKELRRLFLHHNRFEALNLAPDSLPALEQLTLTDNGLKHLGPGIGSLKNLWYLVLEQDRLKALPKEIGNLPSILFAGTYNIFSGRHDAFRAGEFKKLYELALPHAQAGDFRAQYLLGDLVAYESEKNPYYDKEKSIEWYRKAAVITGNANIQYDVGMSLQLASTKHTGPKRNEAKKEAFKWMLASAEQGHAYAQMELAGAYHVSYRYGLERDDVKAYMWYKVASNRFKAIAIMTKGKDVSDKGIVDSLMRQMSKSDKFSEKQKKLSLIMAEKWENDHPDAYKFWPYWHSK